MSIWPAIFLALVSLTIAVMFWRSRVVFHSSARKGLRASIDQLRWANEVIQDLSQDYFITLQNIGAGNVMHILAALERADELCDELGRRGQVSDVEALLNYVYIQEGRGTPPRVVDEYLDSELCWLNLWRDTVQKIFVQTVEGVTTASSSFRAVGRQKSQRCSHPTSALLGKLMELMAVEV